MSTSFKDIPLAHIEDAKNTGVATPVESLDNEKGDDNSLSNQDWDEAEEKALIRKLDLRVFPMLCIIFGLSLLDRTNISAAYIAGLAEDLQLTIGGRCSIALLVFFITYAIFELPSNMIIRRVGARVWLSILITLWGVCALAMGFVDNWVPLTVFRMLLGIFEAGLFPGSVFIIGSFYTQWETARRVSLFYMAALLASGFGSIFAYALSLIRVGDGKYRAGWRWIFIIEGVATVVAGIASFFFLTDFPEKARWLSDRERHIAQAHVNIDKNGRDYKHPTIGQSLKMVLDWKLGVYCIQYFVAASSVYALAYFQPIILMNGMGFDSAKAQLLSTPPYVSTILLNKYRTRWMVLCFQSMAAVTGLLIVLYGVKPGVRYFGLFLAVFGCHANVPATLAYGQSNTPSIAKCGIVSAAMISVGAAGGITGSTIFRSQDAPSYLPGMWATIAMQLLYIAVTFSMSMYFKRQNRLADEGKRPALEGTGGFRYAV